MNYVWLVGIADIETYDVQFVCASEETARKKFEKCKVVCIEYMQNTVDRRPDDKHWQDELEWIKSAIFAEPSPSIHSCPFADRMEVIE